MASVSRAACTCINTQGGMSTIAKKKDEREKVEREKVQNIRS